MKKTNLLSKTEMKKVTGGDDPQSFCVDQVHCKDGSGNTITKYDAPGCAADWVSLQFACVGVENSVSAVCVTC
ncbi:hypothetical protein AQF98_09820 [Pedobacter sp. Hv1]|nr:hypothetical protein AQF98_09820 [Pedobacter sp. Hv1]